MGKKHVCVCVCLFTVHLAQRKHTYNTFKRRENRQGDRDRAAVTVGKIRLLRWKIKIYCIREMHRMRMEYRNQ